MHAQITNWDINISHDWDEDRLQLLDRNLTFSLKSSLGVNFLIDFKRTFYHQ